MGARATKKVLVSVSGFVLLAAVFALGHGNEHGHATAQVGDGTVSVDYHRPMANGRDLLSMIQAGSYWRMGADSPTTLTTEVDLKFGDTTVPKGEYVL